jgi:hypothetical protein
MEDIEIKKINNTISNNKPIYNSVSKDSLKDLQKIKKIINSKIRINKPESFITYESTNLDKIEKENYTENFEDIDYELENNNDCDNLVNNNIITHKTQTYDKILYSPSDNLNINNIQSNIKNLNKINNNNLNISLNSNIILNIQNSKIEYSPCENLHLEKSNICEKSVSLNKMDSNPILKNNYNNQDIININDYKINKIEKKNFDNIRNIQTPNYEEKIKNSEINIQKNKINIETIQNLFDINSINKNQKDPNRSSLDFISKNKKKAEDFEMCKIQNTINKNKIYQILNKKNEEDDKLKMISDIRKKMNSTQILKIQSKNNINKRSNNKFILNNTIRPGTNPITSNNNLLRNNQLSRLDKNKNPLFINNNKANNSNNLSKDITINNSINKNISRQDTSNISINKNNQQNLNYGINQNKKNNNELNSSINNTFPKNSINISDNPKNKIKNFTNLSETKTLKNQIGFFPLQNLNNKINNQVKNKKKSYKDEFDRKFAEDFNDISDFICDEEDDNKEEYKRHLAKIKHNLSRGNNRHLIQDYSDDSISEANFEQIEKEERISSWIAEKEDLEEELRIEEERKKRKMKKKMRRDDEESFNNEE